eukprot:542297-Hanusia_phi.AAC.2
MCSRTDGRKVPVNARLDFISAVFSSSSSALIAATLKFGLRFMATVAQPGIFIAAVNQVRRGRSMKLWSMERDTW